MRFRAIGVAAVVAMSSGVVAGAEITTSTTSTTSATSSKCTPHTEDLDGVPMIVTCELETVTTTTHAGPSTSSSAISTISSSLAMMPPGVPAESSFSRSTTTIPTTSQSSLPTSSQSTTSLLMAPPGPEEPHPDLLTSSTKIPVQSTTSSESLFTLPSTTVTIVPLPSQLSTEIPSLSRKAPASTSSLSYSCPPCDPNATPKTVSIECINGVLPVLPPKEPSPCHCPSDTTKTACYGPHPMTLASSMASSTYSTTGFGPYTFANGTVSMIHLTGTGSAVSAALPTAAIPTSSKSHSTLLLTSTVTSRSTSYVTQPSSSSTTISHTMPPRVPVNSKSDSIPVIIPTISTKSSTSAPCAAVTVTVTTTTVSTLTKFETVLDGIYTLSRQEAHTVKPKPVSVLSQQHPKPSLILKNTPSQFSGVPQPTESTRLPEPSLIPRPMSFGAPGPVVSNPTFPNGVDGVNGGSITTSTPDVIPASVPRGLGGDNDGPPATSSTQYTRGSGDNDGGFPFTVSRRTHSTTNTWVTKTGFDQAPSHLSHAIPAASSGFLPRPAGPHNGIIPVGTGMPRVPSHPRSRPTRFPETTTKTAA